MTQLLLDWRMARGLVFPAYAIAHVAEVPTTKVLRARHAIGFTQPPAHHHSTLGEAVVLAMVCRARLRCTRALVVDVGQMATIIDGGATMPEWLRLANHTTRTHVPTVIGALVAAVVDGIPQR